MKKLYFKAPTPASGYPLQLVADLDSRIVSKGYCIASPWETITQLNSKKDITKLYNTFLGLGFMPEE